MTAINHLPKKPTHLHTSQEALPPSSQPKCKTNSPFKALFYFLFGDTATYLYIMNKQNLLTL